MALKSMVNQALAPLGVRVIREPRPLREAREQARGAGEAAAGGPADALAAPFFPHSPHRGRWGIPADLASRTEPWARVLARLYERQASWPASIAPEVGMLIHALIRNIRPRTVVETGTCLGASTIWMASALALTRQGMIHTFDTFDTPNHPRLKNAPLFKDRLKKVQGRFRRAGVAKHIEVHVGMSAPTIEAMHGRLREAGGVQFAFIDADHTPRGVALDVQAVEPVLQVGGYMLFHDVYAETSGHLGPRHIIDNIGDFAAGRYQACDIYTTPANYGLGLLRRIG